LRSKVGPGSGGALEDAARKRPDVGFARHVPKCLGVKALGRHVVERPVQLVRCLVGFLGAERQRGPKVRQHDVTVVVKEQISWLEVTVEDVVSGGLIGPRSDGMPAPGGWICRSCAQENENLKRNGGKQSTAPGPPSSCTMFCCTAPDLLPKGAPLASCPRGCGRISALLAIGSPRRRSTIREVSTHWTCCGQQPHALPFL
jgi:hypothetical protein